ncbi:MAG: fliE [Paenibacillaceae bacterium]|jgi:flagellar hook-basal body complex protein FliE|nr:fliE [Paenibacillaceae bacterium]
MITKIGLQPASFLKQVQPKEDSQTGAAELGQSFGNMLNNAMTQLSAQEQAVEVLNDQFIRGDAVDAHQLVINAERLSVGLEMTVQIRNKVIEAYQDIMRMQI